MIKISLEISDTPATLAQGLMFRKELADNQGMLFKFPSITEASFWGKNTYIPLDIAFIHNNKIADIKEITPMSTKMVRSSVPCDRAIEVNAGFFRRNQINVGDTVQFVTGESGREIEVFFDAPHS